MSQDGKTPPSPQEATTSTENAKIPSSQTYETFQSRPSPDADNIRQGQKSDNPTRPTLTEGVQSIRFDDFLKIHQIPCAREGFLTGIGSGAAIGAGRYLVGGKATKAAHWAFGAFMLGSVVQWEYCQAGRRRERATMARAVEVMEQKQAEKKAQALRAAQAARLKKEEDERALQAQKRWYKFW